MVENVRTFDKSLIPVRAGGKCTEYTESINVSHFLTIHAFRLDGRLISEKNAGKRKDIRQILWSLLGLAVGGQMFGGYTESTNVSHFGTIHWFRLDGRPPSEKNGGKRKDIQQISDPN